jgi:CheY-like chemotaxis protein
VDWLVGEHPAARIELRAGDSVLEVTLPRVDPGGLRAATEVLGAVQGNLGPEPDGTWRARVPAFETRACYLMVVQAGVPLAIPWHAVLKVRMVGATHLEPRWRHPLPLVAEPPAAAGAAAGGLPLVLVAHGRKRAWLIADRVVWRMVAEREVGGAAPPLPGLAERVRTDEGEHWWVADPGWLLRYAEAPPLPDEPRAASGRPGAAEPGVAPDAGRSPAAPGADRSDAAMHGRPSPGSDMAIAGPAAVPAGDPDEMPYAATPADASRAPGAAEELPDDLAHLPELGEGDIEPLGVPIAHEPPGTQPDAGAAEGAAPPPAPRAVEEPPGGPPRERRAVPRGRERVPGPHGRRALVAEDSITARIFLARMLEQRGFEVETVDTAAALEMALERGRFDVACIDIELPDARGEPLLAGLVERFGGATLVALTRDAEDVEAAARAGVHRALRKPFDDTQLQRLLAQLGLVEGGR